VDVLAFLFEEADGLNHLFACLQILNAPFSAGEDQEVEAVEIEIFEEGVCLHAEKGGAFNHQTFRDGGEGHFRFVGAEQDVLGGQCFGLLEAVGQ
jgi:hypothetical protein